MNKKKLDIVNDGSKSELTASRGRSQFPVDDERYDQAIHCSCKSFQSCSANLLADCVALCCCPCAILNMLVLTFVRLPWNVGKRSMKYLKRKALVARRRRKKNGNRQEKENVLLTVASEPALLAAPPVLMTSLFGEDGDGFSAFLEAEKMWAELHQVGYLGFGRVSFQGFI
ncbi:uncharacterized protein LOC116261075 [Nymphaea colorata]|nr:uncharacterized protein LOC116261075 [Nymphaea colorata]